MVTLFGGLPHRLVTRLPCTELRLSFLVDLGILFGPEGDLRALAEDGRSSSDTCVDFEAVCVDVCVDVEVVRLGKRISGAMSVRK